jgi:hypothetical protein
MAGAVATRADHIAQALAPRSTCGFEYGGAAVSVPRRIFAGIVIVCKFTVTFFCALVRFYAGIIAPSAPFLPIVVVVVVVIIILVVILATAYVIYRPLSSIRLSLARFFVSRLPRNFVVTFAILVAVKLTV